MFAEFPRLQAARERSRATLATIVESLRSIEQDDSPITTIAVAGSLGRLEQTANSDIDLIVVVKHDADADPHVVESVRMRLAGLHMPPTKPGGIFSQPVSVAQLCDRASLGVVDEDLTVFGARMHLLLEARPVYGGDTFDRLVRGVLERFADVHSRRELLWRPLLDDLLRYHRSLCARYRQIERFQPDRAVELRIKAGYSRFINVAGLILLLGESLSAKSDPLEWVHQRLAWTPQKRIGHVLKQQSDASREELFAAYDRFLGALDSDRLTEESDALIASAESLRSIVVSFLLDADRRHVWPRSFLEQLLF